MVTQYPADGLAVTSQILLAPARREGVLRQLVTFQPVHHLRGSTQPQGDGKGRSLCPEGETPKNQG